MSDFSAAVLDIDGTLLNSQGRLSEANLLALRECDRRGIVLYVATARPQRLVFRPSETAEDMSFLTERGAYYNGAVAVDRPLDYFMHRPMSAELVQSLTSYLVDAFPNDLQIAIQNKEEYHSFWLPADDSALVSWGFSREELLPFSEASQRECSKIVAWHVEKDMTEVYHDLLHRYTDSMNIFLTDSRQCLQFVSSEATKQNALLRLLSLRDITPDRVVVFGDDSPDVGMFRTFGCSVAMANAKAALKEIATHVTRNNDEDGVAFALKELLAVI